MDIQGKRVHFFMAAALEKMDILDNLMDWNKKIVCQNQNNFHF